MAFARRKQHLSISKSAKLPLRADPRHTVDSIELRGSERLGNGAEDYEALLPALKRFFYVETKLIDEQNAAGRAQTTNSGHEKSLSGVKAHLVASYHILDAQETALRVTTLISLVEFSICTIVSAGLGILSYIEGSANWTNIASYTLFGLCVAYKLSDYASYFPESWFDINEADYKRLMTEARNRNSDTEY